MNPRRSIKKYLEGNPSSLGYIKFQPELSAFLGVESKSSVPVNTRWEVAWPVQLASLAQLFHLFLTSPRLKKISAPLACSILFVQKIVVEPPRWRVLARHACH